VGRRLLSPLAMVLGAIGGAMLSLKVSPPIAIVATLIVLGVVFVIAGALARTGSRRADGKGAGPAPSTESVFDRRGDSWARARTTRATRVCRRPVRDVRRKFVAWEPVAKTPRRLAVVL